MDGTTVDDDEGLATRAGAADLVPTDSNSIAYSRTPGAVLNIAYLTPQSRSPSAASSPRG